MPALDWNDLQYVLAVAREGSFATAGRRLKIDSTTVSRRVRTIESALGARLFERTADGRMRPTEAGEVVVTRAEWVESQIAGLNAAVSGADAAISGSVRVTSVPILVNRVLIPALPALLERYPDLQIELIADSHDLNLSRRDADVAVRLARPGEEVGDRVFARRIGLLRYGVYVHESREDDAHELPWVTYEEAMGHIPQAKWIDYAAARSTGLAAVAVNDAEPLLQCVLAGLGRSLLPCIVADRVSGIVRVGADGGAPLEREIWTLTHPDVRHLARVAAVLEWIEGTLAGC
ncbi:MAG: LysR family transcriptional regulator [Pseudomonadota bacterium]|jgi:DNA-binding transcriptional LysR family regulator|uniref:LysR family transcriptional regulator n=1 Tax=Burkholderiaceae TaxID=119060 RepID=UPI0010F59CCD|nr:LysR family transcriptional regulator [Burkholderia sp. 4M9327F10]